MIFWFIITISLALAALIAKKGLYEGWAMLFNVVFSIYLGITTAPILIELLSLSDSEFAPVIITLVVGLVCFGILYGLAYIIFLDQFEVKFPKIIDLTGGGITGFLAAFLALAFIIFIISSSPIGKKKPFNSIGLDADTVKSSKALVHMQWWLNKVDSIVGKGKEHNEIDTLIAVSFDHVSKTKGKPEPKDDTSETNEVKHVVEEIKPSDLGPPPELVFEDI